MAPSVALDDGRANPEWLRRHAANPQLHAHSVDDDEYRARPLRPFGKIDVVGGGPALADFALVLNQPGFPGDGGKGVVRIVLKEDGDLAAAAQRGRLGRGAVGDEA